MTWAQLWPSFGDFGEFVVAKLVLDDGKYSWEFLPAAGSTFTDRGEANCVQ